MAIIRTLKISLLISLMTVVAFAQSRSTSESRALRETKKEDIYQFESTRLRGFFEKQRENAQLDKTREAGQLAHDEEYAKWEAEREKAIAEHRKRVIVQSPQEGGPEYKEYQRQKEIEKAEYEAAQKEFAKNVVKYDRKVLNSILPEEKELGLYSDRPRYDYKKRCSLGFSGKQCKPGAMASSGGSSSSGGGSFFPPPPTFDDFGGNDSGYIPAPNLGEGDADFPPPPPPPLFPDSDQGFENPGMMDLGNDYIPPPPPSPF